MRRAIKLAHEMTHWTRHSSRFDPTRGVLKKPGRSENKDREFAGPQSLLICRNS